jgi:hypothetical protein
MKNLILIISTLIISYSLNAQSTFEKVINRGYGQLGSVIQTADGGFAAMGEFNYNGTDKWLVRTDAMGDTLWTRNFPGIGSSKSGDRYFYETPDGGFTFLSGWPQKTSLVHVDANGQTIWEKEIYTGTGNAMSPTSGGYIITGQESDTMFNTKLTVCKVSNNGDVIWKRNYSPHPSTSGISPHPKAIRETKEGGYIVAGNMYNFYFIDIPFLFRIGPTGDSLWYREYNFFGDQSIHSVDTTMDGGFIACGNMNASNRGFTMKVDHAGDSLWTHIFILQIDLYLASVLTTEDGGSVVCGGTGDTFPGLDSNKAYLVKFSAVGNIEWERFIGTFGDSYGACIEHTQDNGFIICGDVNPYGASTKYNGILIKTDGNGNMTGIENHIAEANTWFYPNPASDYTTLSLTSNHSGLPIIIKLYNLFGQQVKIVEVPKGQTNYQMEISDLTPGIYATTIEAPNKPVERAKLVVRR